MSRLSDSIREQARRQATIASGLRMAGDRDLAQHAAIAGHYLTTAADTLDAYDRAAKLAASGPFEGSDLNAAARANGGLTVVSLGARA
jgi:hypothetical protein